MIKGKADYLKRLTASLDIRSAEVGAQMQGSTPPSVFIGSWNYPHVLAGPMVAPMHGDTSILDRPESWIPEKKSQEDIIRYRLNLVRGKQQVRVKDVQGRLAEKLQDIALARRPIESEARFHQPPRGVSFSDEHAPFGPSAMMKSFHIDSVSWDRDLERAYHDTDLRAGEALWDLYKRGLEFSSLQKAFSVGAMGTGRRRRLVPTRWSITACDSAIGNHLLEEVRQNDPIDCYRVHEFYSLNNYYAVILLPTPWQYEWTEAFLQILGHEEMIFSDHEANSGKKGYSRVGGCYYTCKMAVLEALARQREQAGALVLREAYRGYVPLGVFNVRENVRGAMNQPAAEFCDLKAAMQHISTRLALPMTRFVKEGHLIREVMRSRQTTLNSF